MKKIISHIVSFTAVLLVALACEKEPQKPKPLSNGDNVFLLYSMGFTNIDGYLNNDINDIMKSYIPGQSEKDNILLIFSQNVEDRTNRPWTPSEANLYEISKDAKGKIHKKLMLSLPSTAVAASAEVLEQVLGFVREQYPGKNYGMLMSSHGAGWVSMDYVLNTTKYENNYKPADDEEFSMKKSIGDHYDGKTHSSEIDIRDLAEAIPMKLDYLIFDACFMGGVEVAFELKDKVDKVIFSQCEIAGEGMDYENMVSLLLKGPKPDLQGFCESFYRLYEHDTTYGCTLSMVDLRQMGFLASVCRYLNGKYSISDETISVTVPQKYFRSKSYMGADYGYFYDLHSLYRHTGASDEDLNLLQDILDGCIICKYATPKFMFNYGGFETREYSGLSMYLPLHERLCLNDYYKSLKWNQATGLIK